MTDLQLMLVIRRAFANAKRTGSNFSEKNYIAGISFFRNLFTVICT